jgi:trypsin
MPPSVALVYHAALKNDLVTDQFCGGVVIGQSLIATDAHCVSGVKAKSIDAVVGSSNLCRGKVSGERFTVTNIKIVGELTDGIAFLTVDGQMAGPFAQLSKGLVGTSIDERGWGRLGANGQLPCEIVTKSLQIVSLNLCASDLAAVHSTSSDSSDYICAAPTGALNTCQGDSGSPIYDATSGAVLGLTLRGVGCGPHDPGLYLSASYVAHSFALLGSTTSSSPSTG